MAEQILQVEEGGNRFNLGEPLNSDVTKRGLRAVDIDARLKLEAIRALLASALSVTGTLELGEATLVALETINAVCSGKVDVKTSGNDTVAIAAPSLPLPAGAATEDSLGTDGVGAPVNPGTGIRGWLRGIYERMTAKELTERLMSKAPAAGYDLWLDLADSSFSYMLEAPLSTGAADVGFRGIRISIDADGKYLGKVQRNTNAGLTFNNRKTVAGWS